MDDPRYINLLQEVTSSPNDVLLIFRNKEQANEYSKRQGDKPFQARLVTDGQIEAHAFPSLLLGFLTESLAFLSAGYRLPEQLCFELLKLPFYRLVYRAFLQKYSFRNFLGRDDYDTRHIIRTNELRKSNARALGINHGLPHPSRYYGVWRYLDFDYYYTFGTDIYERYLKFTWSDRMVVRQGGSFGMSTKQMQRLNSSRPNNIVIFTNTMPGYEVLLDWAVDIAHRFPDRTVFLKHKRSRGGEVYSGSAVKLPTNIPPNLIESSDNSYNLMEVCSFALSTPNSTIVVEAIQFGLATFVWNARETLATSYYRNFPYLCLDRSAEFSQHIEEIESGKASYPTEQFSKIAHLSEKTIYSIIRDDLVV